LWKVWDKNCWLYEGKHGLRPYNLKENHNKDDIENWQEDLNTLGEWELEIGIKINPGKCKGNKIYESSG